MRVDTKDMRSMMGLENITHWDREHWDDVLANSAETLTLHELSLSPPEYLADKCVINAFI